jgi:hypothetical protein
LRRLRTLLGATALAATSVVATFTAASPAARWPALIPKSEVVCQFSTKALPEISGLAMSATHRNVLWATNDSGNGAYLYALDARNCKIRAKLRLLDTPARDHEALAVGRDASGRSVIWIGDIGDNILDLGGWPYLRIHKVYEPQTLKDASVPVTTYRFKYPDGAHDAEALLAAPRAEKLWVVTKDRAGGGIYELPRPLSPSQTPMKAKKIGTARALITDGAMAPNGRRYVLRDYLSAEVFAGQPTGTPKARFALPLQTQGESITWSADGRSLYVASEGSGDLLRVAVPASALGAEGGIAAMLPRVAGFDIYPFARALAVLAGLGVALFIARRLWRRRRTS